MNSFFIQVDERTDYAEFIKAISFISPLVEGFEEIEGGVKIFFSPQADENELKQKTEKILDKFKLTSTDDDQIYYENRNHKRKFFDLSKKNINLIQFGKGQIGFHEKGSFLMDYFDSKFCGFAAKFNALEKTYPAMLPLTGYAMTGYLKKSPQYAIFCSPIEESMEVLENTNKAVSEGNVKGIEKEPEFALSPSACFHAYLEYENQTFSHNTILTFKQNVFRNEGRFNFSEIGRLIDYHVREIVMVGTEAFVNSRREEFMELTKNFMNEINLDGSIRVSTDSFIIPKMQIYKKIQKIDKSKFETQLFINKGKSISTASFNLHGKAFTDPFNISVKKTKETVTGCVGFGLERWVLAFVAQYGWDEKNWPESIRETYQKKLNGGCNE